LKGLELNATHQLLVFAAVYMLGERKERKIGVC